MDWQDVNFSTIVPIIVIAGSVLVIFDVLHDILHAAWRPFGDKLAGIIFNTPKVHFYL